MNFLVRIITTILLFLTLVTAFGQSPKLKGNSVASSEQRKERQKQSLLKQQKDFREKHYNRQTKKTKTRMIENLKQTDKYYNQRRQSIWKRIFKKKYNKH